MGFDQYHEPPEELSPEVRTKARLFAALTEEAEAIKNSDIVTELNLPPVKIHCSVLAEDAIKSAIADYRAKQAAKRG